ncbi:MAG: DUF3108 domain-containing protein [Lysobacteraceae bacterium]|nr:MAG: DUF3108 domain-containing protein [Xanthomonadaceae bacterium]
MTRTRRGVRALVTPLALLLALGAAALPAWAAQALKPFTATYDVKYMGLNGKATMVLAPTGDNAWKYSLDIDSAIANLSQNTVFEADGGRWRPLSNSDSTMLLIKKNARHASYDWNKREARWTGNVKRDRAGPVALRDGDLDAMLLNLAIPRDVAAGQPLDYRMVDDGRAKQMRYKVVGKETVKVGGQSRTATKVSRVDDDKQQLLWIVPGLPVPARILQRKDGKDEMDLVLTSIQ